MVVVRSLAFIRPLSPLIAAISGRFTTTCPRFPRPSHALLTMTSNTVGQNPTIRDADALLKSRFGFDGFRPGQRRIIELLLAGQPTDGIAPSQTGNAMAIFPTGSGKSICYQLPSLLFEDGLTLVVSPLMALMKDQVDSLVKRDVAAACLDSSLDAAETRELYERIAARDLSILFVSPERFNNSRFVDAIKRVPIALFAIDEAHCISEWGHSFRPDYLRLARWAARLNVQRRLALTATATPAVARDIASALDIPFPAGQVRLLNVRPNLTTRVSLIEASPSGTYRADILSARVDMLATRLRERDVGPTIVYVTLQTTAAEVAEMLRMRGFIQAASYHGGMKQDDRKRVQDEFMANLQDGLVVATIAFGMGMDHASIRYVYHLNMPKSLENYIQEIGRAGRDGLPSICEAFVSVDDVPLLEGFIYGEAPSRAAVHAAVNSLFENLLPGKDDIEYSAYGMSFEHDIRDTSFGQMMAQLDLSEGLVEQTTPYFSTIECGMLPINQRRWPPQGSIGDRILKSGVKKATIIHLDVKKTAEETGLEYGRISRICDDMVRDGYLAKNNSRALIQRMTVKKRPPTDLKPVADRLYLLLMKSRDRQVHRLQQMVDFFSTTECQTLHLANHLGDKLDIAGPCGHCESCLSDKPRAFDFKEVVRHRVVRPLDERRWAAVQLAQLPKDPYLMARFAAGISSPIISRKFRKMSAFGSMSDHDFKVLLKAASKECNVPIDD